MKTVSLLGMGMLMLPGAAPPSSAKPALPPVRWGLWEESATGLPGMDDGPYVTRSCLSAVTWKGFMNDHGDDSRHCVWSNQSAASSSYKADVSCAAGKITGHGQMTIDSPESFHYTMSIDLAQDGRKPTHFDVRGMGRFLGRSCAGLKPGEEMDVWE